MPRGGTDYGPFGRETADGMLNELGRQGWEVCPLTGAETEQVVIVLKRRVDGPGD